MNADRCYDPSLVYRPQWPAKTPDGFTDETFIVPFSFLQVPATGQLVRGLPWSLDDDAVYIIQGIIFEQIGLSRAIDPTALPAGEGLCRIWDCMGNPLSQGLVLGLGMWGNASVGPVDAATGLVQFGFGWPLEDELICPPGGTLLFDFQISTNATVAFFQIVDVVLTITFFAPVFGTGGNGITITLIDPGAPNIPLSLAIVGVNVEVTLATDGAGVVTSTFQDIANIVNAEAVGFMTAVVTLT